MTDPAPRPAPTPPRGRALLAATCCALIAVPFLAVTFPPVTDLGQHAAQVRLFLEALGDPEGPYRIQWLTPYGLSYLAVGAGWLVGGPLAAGRLGLLLVAVAWVGAVHLLAWRRDRPAAAAVLASVLVFNHALYWGFLGFLAGWPVFVLWLLWTLREPDPDRPLREGMATAALAAVLYLTHALWFAAGLAWFAAATLATGLRQRQGWRPWMPRLLGTLPVAAGAVAWYAAVSRTSFATPPLWVRPPSVRLSPEGLVDAALGGLHGRVEPLLLALLLAWLALAVLTNRRRLGEKSDRPLALLGAVLVVAALVLPDKLTNTIEFNDRWMPVGLACLLLAAPPPRLGRRLGRRLGLGAAVLLLAGFALVTTLIWRQVERHELSGLETALEALPPEPRLLSLDYLRRSPLLKGQPFFQQFAYGQALRGGRLSFSFAEFPPSPVVLKVDPPSPWTPGLEWFPQTVKRSDLLHFDHVLVGGPPRLHGELGADPLLVPVTREGLWRLYRVQPEGLTMPGPPPPSQGPP